MKCYTVSDQLHILAGKFFIRYRLFGISANSHTCATLGEDYWNVQKIDTFQTSTTCTIACIS